MKVTFKLPDELLAQVQEDLARPHLFAMERVGFLACRAAYAGDDLVVIASGYESIPDDEYTNDFRVGAMMGPAAIRRGMNLAYNRGAEDISVFHVHEHPGIGIPRFSPTDSRETAKFVPDFFHVASKVPHGALILSSGGATGRVWLSETADPIRVDRILSVGVPTKFLHLP